MTRSEECEFTLGKWEAMGGPFRRMRRLSNECNRDGLQLTKTHALLHLAPNGVTMLNRTDYVANRTTECDWN